MSNQEDLHRDLALAALLWPLCVVLLLVAYFAPVNGELAEGQVVEEVLPGTTANAWANGLMVAAIVLATLVSWRTSSFVVAVWAWLCLILAVWVGFVLNLGMWGEGAIGAVILVVLLIIPGIWLRWWAAREARGKKGRATSRPSPTAGELHQMHEQVERAISDQSARGGSRGDIEQLERIRDELERRIATQG